MNVLQDALKVANKCLRGDFDNEKWCPQGTDKEIRLLEIAKRADQYEAAIARNG